MWKFWSNKFFDAKCWSRVWESLLNTPGNWPPKSVFSGAAGAWSVVPTSEKVEPALVHVWWWFQSMKTGRRWCMYNICRLKLTLSDKSQACFLGRFRQGGANHIGCWGVGTNLCRCGCSGPIFASDTWGAWILRKLILLSVSVAPSEQATLQLICNFIKKLPPLAKNGFDSLSNYVRHRKLWKCIFGQYVSVGWLKVEQLDNSGDSCLRFTRPPP